MRDLIIITGMCAAAILVGAWLYFYGPTDALNQGARLPVPEQAASAGGATPETHVSFTVIGHGAHASVSERKNYAVYTEEEFAKLWKRSGATEKMPVVDFNKAYVVGVFAGDVPTSGYTISVAKIVDTGDVRTIHILLEKPGAGCNTAQAVTSPYQFVRVPFGNEATLTRVEVTKEVVCD